ncbi:MAG: hopanoid biosynthesis associated radical SAM protein HpnH [Planctomycetes bacterium RIFCSPHIGHO2_02_FULL_38_41]|nr:MAG: hopanoid biosynthesis associated radical SAM protein HpnH [Planctomycetes bacterium RIFCSPHIGHO2_02_FULL_38_41]OHB97604.1 MAG: hopanoid biosynthesis associated radical SAM protein HpnH [Planctomycetes bacterium RIFCSPLOWO2_12_38_17]
MRISLSLSASLIKYLIKNKLLAIKRFPLVLMLEVTHTCNLACEGCGRIREYKETMKEMLSTEECLQAIEKCPAPVVTVTGGEPLMHPEIDRIINGIINRKRHVYLCTNGLLLVNAIKKLKPSKYFNVNVHIDGLEKTHDAIAGKGVFERATDAIREAKRAGFRVCTNTTIYKNTTEDELEELFSFLEGLGVDGMLVSPGFSFEHNKNGMFLCRKEVEERFGFIYGISSRYKILNSPLYLKFLKGERHLRCTPWGNPTRNYMGWKSPCYLITDAHYKTFSEYMENTDWKRYQEGGDPRCKDCMMHCGFEPTVVLEGGKRLSDIVEMARWSLR